MLIVAPHPCVRSPSMLLFANWFKQALAPVAEVRAIAPRPHVYTERTRGLTVGKWLGYLDRFLLFAPRLAAAALHSDVVLFADHGDSLSAWLTPRRKLAVMVHDTIAMRQALGLIEGAPPVGWTGRAYQALIRAAVRRARVLLSNPGAVPGEIAALQLGGEPLVVGCPVDLARLASEAAASPVSEPYVLCVASDQWRKNKSDLAPLWAEVCRRQGPALALAGHTEPQTLELFRAAGVQRLYVFNGASEPVLAVLYAHCAGVISPSRQEGFCIPVVEGLASGKPVFTPDLSPSYVDFFGAAVTRLPMHDPARAAEMLLQELEAPMDRSIAAAHVLAWSSMESFAERVRRLLPIMASAQGGL